MGDKQPKCFVPECNNGVGVLFPKNPDVKKKWLKALGLEHLRPDPKSFVCLDHFEENGQPSIRQEITAASQSKYINDGWISSSVLQQKVIKQEQEELRNSKPSRRTYGKKEKANTSTVYTSDNHENYQEEATVYSVYEKACRLCMSQSSDVTNNVFNKIDDDHTVAQAISICLYPLKVLPNDNLSKNICSNCVKTLKKYLKFHNSCIAADTKQREVAPLEHYASDENYADSEHSEYLHEERLSDYEEDKENKEDYKKDNTNGRIVKHLDSSSINDDVNGVEKTINPYTVPLKKKCDIGDEELLKVLEGNDEVILRKLDKSKSEPFHCSTTEKLPAEESNDDMDCDIANGVHEIHQDPDVSSGYTENIIIEMVSDDTSQPSSPILPEIGASKLPITIKRVGDISPKRQSVKRKFDSNNGFNTKKNLTMVKTENSEEIVILPSGISVELKETYNSPLGWFKSQQIRYILNSIFLLAGDYLYEYRLTKNNVRRLRCIVQKCPGTAQQARLRLNEFSNDIEVVVPHDHEPPDDVEKKKQMFYQILYGKMRRDKNFNFKILYEQLCKLDPVLTKILPLRHVIREICKQGPSPPPPVLNSFDDFYDMIESDDLHKIHFTEGRTQFYQERFETADGGKAVVFGNQEIIEKYSQSKLMYVDASFVIESEDFPYQLVTVLLWVEQSYYPVLFAVVNMKSQDLYKKVFSFLYQDLGPNLRPREIITDYEANLYYALGETYVESSIGGSMFYFTQNIYKKICALNLSRELELNSNFRSIYNMLLMLPLLPVNTISDGLSNIEVQAKELGLEHLTSDLFVHIRNEWICKVTPELFCVHRLENRINENIVAPFKKFRDLIMMPKSKSVKVHPTSSILMVLEKFIELEKFLRDTYSTPSRKSFAKDLSSTQKKIILKAWNYIENHPMININQFFLKVLGYIKCMENQLWIWGFYRYTGNTHDTLIDANNFSIINDDSQMYEYQEQLEDDPAEEDTESQNMVHQDDENGEQNHIVEEYYIEEGGAIRKVAGRKTAQYVDELVNSESQNVEQQVFEQHKEKGGVVMQAVIDENGRLVLTGTSKASGLNSDTKHGVNYVYK